MEENNPKQELINLQTKNYNKQKSFAEVVKNNNKNTINKKTSHVITIFCKDKDNEDITSNEIRNQIKSKINPT
jgi:hypothetical protein